MSANVPHDQRQAVFARIREALRTPAPHRHVDHGHAELVPGPETPPPAADTFETWLPDVGPNRAAQLELFLRNSEGLRTEVRRAANPAEAAAQLQALAREAGWRRIAAHRAAPVAALAETLGLPCLFTDGGYATADLEACDAGLTACDALVAQTGSVLVSTASAGGRALSVLPPHHVVVAREEQLVPDLAAALRLVRDRYAPAWPSALSFITGPSRTGDIERILVLGAHGPKRLTILLLP